MYWLKDRQNSRSFGEYGDLHERVTEKRKYFFGSCAAAAIAG
jgi:hypothetical protein